MIETLKTGKDIKKISRAIVGLIKHGKVLIFPTDTVYGLVADATNKNAVQYLFKIKKRQKGKAVPIFVKDIKTAKKLAHIDEKQENFLKKVWPGKLTIVLKRKKGYKIYGVDKNTIALRIPKYPLLFEIMKMVNRPLTGTSANISGKPSSTKIKQVISQFGKEKNLPDLILDAGNLKRAKPSSIIDLTKKKLKILRRGEQIP
ncbi:MAG: L-threonylcarbamoyladenylate synthase [Patescibacteria group bacterium]